MHRECLSNLSKGYISEDLIGFWLETQGKSLRYFIQTFSQMPLKD